MKNRAFTLIELLVVVLIIGILSAIALPQYQKAVTKARFAEALQNLKALAQANQLCYMEKGGQSSTDGCTFDELSISIGEELWNQARSTENFTYFSQWTDTNDNEVWAKAAGQKEDVCLCYLRDGSIVLSQEGNSCNTDEVPYDYSKLLNIPDVGYENCGCC